MAFYSNLFRSLNVKQFILVEKRFSITFRPQIHSNFDAIKTYSMDHHLSSLTANDSRLACASYKMAKNLREKVKHTLIDNDDSTQVRVMPSRKPIPLPGDDATNTMLRKNYGRRN